MGRRTAQALLALVVGGLIAIVWLVPGPTGPVHRLQSELLCAFLGLVAVVLIATPAAVALSAYRRRWPRTLPCVPAGALVGVATWLHHRDSGAELTHTLVIAGGVAAALGGLVLVERRRRPRA